MPSAVNREVAGGGSRRGPWGLLLALACAALFLLVIVPLLDRISPLHLYYLVVNRLTETGVIEPHLAYFLAPLPTLAFIYAAGGTVAAFLRRRKRHALAMAALLAAMGLVQAAVLGRAPKYPINPITQKGNYRWFRSSGTEDFPEGEITYVNPWWNSNGHGYPVFDLTREIDAERTSQERRRRGLQDSYTQRLRALDAEKAAFAERVKAFDEHVKATRQELDRQVRAPAAPRAASEAIGVAGVTEASSAEVPVPRAMRKPVASGLREPASRSVRLDLEPAHSIDGKDMYLWAREVILFKDRTVLKLACRAADESKEGFLVVHHVNDYRRVQPPYLVSDGNVAELIDDPLDKTRHSGSIWADPVRTGEDTGVSLKAGQTLAFGLEFQSLPMDATHLKLFHRQFGMIDIPLGSSVPRPTQEDRH